MSDGPDQLSSADMSSLLDERGPIHVHVGGTALFAASRLPSARSSTTSATGSS